MSEHDIFFTDLDDETKTITLKEYFQKSSKLTTTIDKSSTEIEDTDSEIISSFKTSAKESGFIGYEDVWDEIEIYDGRIVDVLDDSIEVECLLKEDTEYFEKRNFYKLLFENIEVKVGKYVRIRVMIKAGKMTITIRDGENLVNKKIFLKGTTIPKDEIEILDIKEI